MKTETQLVPYSLEVAKVEALKTKYMDITIKPDDKAAYAMVMSGLRECREIRLDVDSWHKERKEWINKAAKHYDSERRRVHALVAPIEDHLSAARKIEDNRKERIRVEAERKEKERIEGIRARLLEMEKFVLSFPGKSLAELMKIQDELAECSTPESVFMEFTKEATAIHNRTIDALSKAIENQTRFEAELKAQKAEAKRLAKIRAEQEAQRKALEEAERKIKEAQAKIEADRKALETAQRAEQERKDREEFERRAREEAKARAEAEAKAKAEREAKEAAERAEKERIEKERQEALRPDKEKIINFITALMKVPVPDVGTESAKQLVDAATTALKKWASKLMKQAGDL